LQAAKNPTVFKGEEARIHREQILRKGSGLFQMREEEAASVPDFIRKVSSDFEFFAGVDFAAMFLKESFGRSPLRGSCPQGVTIPNANVAGNDFFCEKSACSLQ